MADALISPNKILSKMKEFRLYAIIGFLMLAVLHSMADTPEWLSVKSWSGFGAFGGAITREWFRRVSARSGTSGPPPIGSLKFI